MNKTILVLGAYGNFGSLICRQLAERHDINLLIAGRNERKARKFCQELREHGANCDLQALAIDINAGTFTSTLRELSPYVVIHTCGPFQAQDYRVARTCIEAGCHYIDLADERRFVCDFDSLDSAAKEKGVMAISGASTVPGLSSVVIDKLAKDYSQIDEIDYCIVPGSNVDLGLATLQGILSYIGQPFTTLQQGKMTKTYCWLNLKRIQLAAPLNSRWLADVDIPDLELFPERYRGIKSLHFKAGHELGLIHLCMALLAILSKWGLLTGLDRYAKFFYKIGQKIKVLGSDTGGMVVRLRGLNQAHSQQTTVWRLIAKDGVGPRVPTISSIILLRKILDEQFVKPGASACLGMYSLDEFFDIASKWGIYFEQKRQPDPGVRP